MQGKRKSREYHTRIFIILKWLFCIETDLKLQEYHIYCQDILYAQPYVLKYITYEHKNLYPYILCIQGIIKRLDLNILLKNFFDFDVFSNYCFLTSDLGKAYLDS